MKKRGLCIVDMQPNFPAAKDLDTAYNVIKEIRCAKSKNNPIFILEYAGTHNKSTHQIILDEIKGYKKSYIIEKGIDDGSPYVRRCIAKNNLEVEVMRVVGVNVCACVRDTAEGLANTGEMEVQVIKKACNCYTGNKEDHFNSFRKMNGKLKLR